MALAFQQLRRANSENRIPQVAGRPQRHPREIYAYRAIGILLLLVGSQTWSSVIGLWSVALILVGFIPAFVLNIRHNRTVAADPGSA